MLKKVGAISGKSIYPTSNRKHWGDEVPKSAKGVSSISWQTSAPCVQLLCLYPPEEAIRLQSNASLSVPACALKVAPCAAKLVDLAKQGVGNLGRYCRHREILGAVAENQGQPKTRRDIFAQFNWYQILKVKFYHPLSIYLSESVMWGKQAATKMLKGS